MNSKRLFISLPIDTIISKDIFQNFSKLNLTGDKLKYTKPEQMHLTLKFLGDFDIVNIPHLIDTLSKIHLDTKGIELHINQTKIFNSSQPKVLALTIESNKNLQNLYDQIDQILFDEGLANKEVRKFSAHLSLARIKKAATFKEFENFNKWSINKTTFATYFQLQESELTKQGPIYTTLQTFEI